MKTMSIKNQKNKQLFKRIVRYGKYYENDVTINNDLKQVSLIIFNSESEIKNSSDLEEIGTWSPRHGLNFFKKEIKMIIDEEISHIEDNRKVIIWYKNIIANMKKKDIIPEDSSIEITGETNIVLYKSSESLPPSAKRIKTNNNNSEPTYLVEIKTPEDSNLIISKSSDQSPVPIIFGGIDAYMDPYEPKVYDKSQYSLFDTGKMLVIYKNK